jgi:hypothetical protein
MFVAIAITAAALFNASFAQTCGRVVGDDSTFCSSYFDAVGEYFRAGSSAPHIDAAASIITQIQANHTLSSACIDHLTAYYCSQGLPPCAPEGTDPIARRTLKCSSSCTAMVDACPAFKQTSFYSESMCNYDDSDIETNPSAPCFDVIAEQIVNQDSDASTGSNSSASVLSVSVATAMMSAAFVM